MKLIKLLSVLMLVGAVSLAYAASEKRSGKLLDFQGNVELKIGSAEWTAAVKDTALTEGDMIRTKDNSWATVELENAGTVEIKQNSQLKLAELNVDKSTDSQKTLLDLALGEVLIKAEKLNSEKSKFEVKTPTSIVGVRGTTFSVAVEAVE